MISYGHMPITSKSTKVPSLFPVELETHDDGTLFLRDVQGVRYSVKNKDKTPLSKKDIDAIIIKRMSYWTIAKKYQLESV